MEPAFELNEPPICLPETMVRARMTATPINRLNLVDWMKKNLVSSNHTSLIHATTRAIESQDKN